MSLIFHDSCNIHGSSLVRYDAGSSFASTTGRFEGNAIQLGNASFSRLGAFPNDPLMIWAGNVRSQQSPATANFIVIEFKDGSTVQVRVTLSGGVPGGSIQAFRGTSTSLGSAAISWAVTDWHYVEVEAFIDPTSGYVKVYVRDTLILDLTSQNTRNSANSWANGFTVSSFTGGPNAVDEYYMLNGQGSINNSRQGPKRVSSFDLSGDGNSNDWTPSSGGSRYLLVDERNSFNAADYVESDTAGQKQLYTVTPRSLPNIGVIGYGIVNVGIESGITPRQGRALVRTNGADYNGPTFDFASNSRADLTIFEQNPDTAAAWNMSEIDGAEIGHELVS